MKVVGTLGEQHRHAAVASHQRHKNRSRTQLPRHTGLSYRRDPSWRGKQCPDAAGVAPR